jgi:hydroxymethylbilane synthase
MIRLATRGSALALVQARLAADTLTRLHPGEEFVLTPLETRGDRSAALPLTDAQQEGIFVKELEQALLDGRADLAVHSAKDLPTAIPPPLVLAAFLPRADARDVLVSRAGATLSALPSGATVGTGSPRRTAQLRALRPDLEVVPIRGNVDTRIRKVRDGVVDAAILAAAGLQRLGREADVAEWLSFEVMLPAPGQGALALQAIEGSHACRLATASDDAPTRRAVEVERSLLRRLGGGCLTPVAAYASLEGGRLHLRGAVLSASGRDACRAEATAADAEAALVTVLERLRELGADRLLREDRRRQRPLAGLRVLVTRASPQADSFAARLEDSGAEVVRVPTITIERLDVQDDPRLRDLQRYEWLVFTSANGVLAFTELLGHLSISFPKARLAAIGPETAAALRESGHGADVVPGEYVAESLAEALPDASRVLLPRAAGSRDALPDRLRARGASVDVLELYRAVAPPGLTQRLREALPRIDLVTFTSASTVRHFIEAVGNQLPAGVRVACIGPITAGAARDAGLPIAIIAEEYTTQGLVDAVIRDRLGSTSL